MHLSLLLLSAAGVAQLQPTDYERTTYEIRARDGVTLHTVVFAPKNAAASLPILFQRTPYGVDGANLNGAHIRDLVKDGYIFAFQDVRGHYSSGGTFVMMRPWRRDRKDPKAIDEATDAYDSIDWMVKHLPKNSGRVGMYGISYDGWTTLSAAVDPHPALKAASPQASPMDMWLNDDFHHNGAFRLSYGFEYAYAMETGKEWVTFPFKTTDVYDWYLNLGPLSNVNKEHFKGKIPTWTGFVQHPNHDSYWTNGSVAPLLDTPKVPVLSVAGWWDQEDPWGPFETYRLLKRKDPRDWNSICAGPWNHGGWAGTGSQLGKLKFGSETGTYFQQKVQEPFFAYWLKDRGTKPAAVTMFETGTNRWRSFATWPPAVAKKNRLYLEEARTLAFQSPRSATGSDSYTSDPANPVPYRARPIEPTYAQGSRWWDWRSEDQSFVAGRPDVAVWQSPALKQDFTIAGPVMADIFAATSGTDSDWVVKLIDVYPADEQPAGHQLIIAADVLRGRFRNSLTKPQPVKSGAPEKYRFQIGEACHTFKKGHRMMVQIQSTWFPIIDRNPQTFVPNIFEAKASDFKGAKQTVFRTAKMPSGIEVWALQD